MRRIYLAKKKEDVILNDAGKRVNNTTKTTVTNIYILLNNIEAHIYVIHNSCLTMCD